LIFLLQILKFEERVEEVESKGKEIEVSKPK
jgi:hypothetical protein